MLKLTDECINKIMLTKSDNLSLLGFVPALVV